MLGATLASGRAVADDEAELLDDATTPLFDDGAGDSLALHVAGYQFPESDDDYFDSNWLMISARASIDGRAWSFEDPCLLTFELARLADWVEALASGGDPDRELRKALGAYPQRATR